MQANLCANIFIIAFIIVINRINKNAQQWRTAEINYRPYNTHMADCYTAIKNCVCKEY